jgi:hypothetical protein
MRPSTQQYSELPVEEKSEDEILALAKVSKWSKKAIALVASMLLLGSLLLVIGASTFFAKDTVVETEEISPEEWLAARATGDQYLLGVGKADMTGYVNTTNHIKEHC